MSSVSYSLLHTAKAVTYAKGYFGKSNGVKDAAISSLLAWLLGQERHRPHGPCSGKSMPSIYWVMNKKDFLPKSSYTKSRVVL
jgi:hypothetical protein